jgi:uridine kinase
VGDLNSVVADNMSTLLINVSEALQEKKIGAIADEIAHRRGVKIVLIAGPSSSGKTTTCKRLSVQLLTCGIRPVGISLDDYFLDREQTPRDANGDYDFESLYALDLERLNADLNALLDGREVELPRYNFHTGRSEQSGRRLRLEAGDVLVVEGIHALNPELTSHVADNRSKTFTQVLPKVARYNTHWTDRPMHLLCLRPLKLVHIPCSIRWWLMLTTIT